MDEWIHSSRPPYGCKAEVWLRDGSVRKIETDMTPMGVGMFFTDCTHPLQNIICNQDLVKAWRMTEAPRQT